MSFTKFEKDISYVSNLPDIPTLENGYTPKVLKQTFDRAGEDLKGFVNESLIRELEEEGSVKIGCKKIENINGNTLQSVLESFAVKIHEIANGAVPDGSVTPDKFVDSIRDFITSGSLRRRTFLEAGEYTFTPTRSGMYKVEVQGAGGGGSLVPSYPFRYSYGGGGGAWGSSYLTLEKGSEYKIVVGRGGKGLVAVDGKFMSDAECGGNSFFSCGDDVLISADGGKIQKHITGPATTQNAEVQMLGGYPLFSNLSDDNECDYRYGGASRFGQGALDENHGANIGAGGYGARYIASYSTYESGGDGADGAVIIEWVE